MSDELKPPKGWRWLEVGEVITEDTKLLTPVWNAGSRRTGREAYRHIVPLKSGDKPVTQAWLIKHKKISWNIADTLVSISFRPPKVCLVFECFKRQTMIPIENRRHLKQILKALRLPFEKVN